MHLHQSCPSTATTYALISFILHNNPVDCSPCVRDDIMKVHEIVTCLLEITGMLKHLRAEPFDIIYPSMFLLSTRKLWENLKWQRKKLFLGLGIWLNLVEYIPSPWFDHWHWKVAHASNLSVEAREIKSLNLHSDTQWALGHAEVQKTLSQIKSNKWLPPWNTDSLCEFQSYPPVPE